MHAIPQLTGLGGAELHAAGHGGRRESGGGRNEGEEHTGALHGEYVKLVRLNFAKQRQQNHEPVCTEKTEYIFCFLQNYACWAQARGSRGGEGHTGKTTDASPARRGTPG